MRRGGGLELLFDIQKILETFGTFGTFLGNHVSKAGEYIVIYSWDFHSLLGQHPGSISQKQPRIYYDLFQECLDHPHPCGIRCSPRDLRIYYNLFADSWSLGHSASAPRTLKFIQFIRRFLGLWGGRWSGCSIRNHRIYYDLFAVSWAYGDAASAPRTQKYIQFILRFFDCLSSSMGSLQPQKPWNLF